MTDVLPVVPLPSSPPITMIASPLRREGSASRLDASPPTIDPPTLDSSPSSSPPSTASEASTPTNVSILNHSHSQVVPAYPYNVSMIPQSHNGPTPDDSGITTRLPSICVDYLAHDWEEEDVWTSWKAMTRHKSEIANGVRLENASWRTWAKQRGNLKTISPETLNW
jgi:hypothetical protein